MTTIDVVPLSGDLSGDNAPINPDNSENAAIIAQNTSINAENPPTIAPKRRGRPAGSKDGTKRKTPVRAKKTPEPARPVAEPPPPPPAPEIRSSAEPKKPKKPKKEKNEQAATGVRVPSVRVPSAPPPKPEPQLTPSQLLRHLQHQQRAQLDDHWSRIIGPMFI